ncbi:hypothetical protein RND81_02G218100 [Saponaria officinalis]|uniref:Uncharacterized protein n=1 Tax=Saponaria officinalis TaxID=3572 RepID=A0AAW1MN61_SAPOF
MGMNPTCSCTCTCGSKQKQIKYQEDRRIVQFLMGLNDSYTSIRGTIIMQNQLPKLAVVYNNLVQEERQREIHNTSQFQIDSASMYAKSNRNLSSYGQNLRHNPYSGNATRSVQGYNGTQAFKRPYNGGNPKNQSNSDVFCNYCKRSGHKVDQCFKLQNRNKKFAANVHCTDSAGIMGDFGDSQHAFRANDAGQFVQVSSTTASMDFQNNEQMDSVQYIPSSVNFAGNTFGSIRFDSSFLRDC